MQKHLPITQECQELQIREMGNELFIFNRSNRREPQRFYAEERKVQSPAVPGTVEKL